MKIRNFIETATFLIVMTALIFGTCCLAKTSMQSCMKKGGTFRSCANI